MNKLNAPAFRKSMSGYKKDDVNNYILTLNRKYSEAEKDHKHSLSKANAEIEELKIQLESNQNLFEAGLAEKNKEVEALNSKCESYEEEIKLKNAEIDGLKAEIDILRTSAETKKTTIADSFGGITDESEKAVLFDCISAKTGEIMLIACKTADDIIAKAKSEAASIINEANMKKDAMLKNISGSADVVASDISSYIKNAVDGCIDKIYTSIKTVDSGK